MAIAVAPLALLIDDCEDAREKVAEALVELGFAVKQRTTTVGALAMVRALAPTIVLCDLSMPLMTGDELVAAIRRDPYVHNMRVLLYGASDDPRAVARRAALLLQTRG